MESSELTLFVTHVEPEGLLLRIWGHRDRKAVSCIDEMIQPLCEKFSQGLGVPKPGLNLPAGLICCARYPNEKYRRAKICRMQPDGTILVHFIDYGNSEVLPPSAIRLLRHHRNGPRLQALQPLAVDFVLADVMAANGGWDVETMDLIRQTLCLKHVTGEFYSVFNTPRLFKLCHARIAGKIRSTYKTRRMLKISHNDEDFGEFLVGKKLAMRASEKEMFAMRMYVFQVPQSCAGYKNDNEDRRTKIHKETRNENFSNRNKFRSFGTSRDNNRAFDSIKDSIWRGVSSLFRGKGRKRNLGSQGHRGKRQPTRRQRRRQSTEFRKMERRRHR